MIPRPPRSTLFPSRRSSDLADWLLVSARISGGQRDSKGIGVFLVPASATGLSRKDFPTLDGGRASRSVEHTSELQSHVNLVCRLLLEKKKKKTQKQDIDIPH